MNQYPKEQPEPAVPDINCFRCGEPLSPENDGILMNEGTPHEMFQCADCHHIEFGYWPWCDVQYFASKTVF